ncbi:hypothetical protein HELRODRAFT_98055 [Helobdella robusta]|uniref:Cyclic nucleotide-binding domain-containing protein n=1 Tax=Helobdella robusta TaxID=6412 RepID=T1G9K3_HELRO|nr:hypothetical protein HELRODRAFT_98055 [Helobdella robusta]ESO08635.1 hypothetical protein HELRODRAFT_98055 [Helobdella robusta]
MAPQQFAPYTLRDHISSFFQVSDNKLAMKLFGNRTALMKEKQRQKEAGSWIIHPCSNFRFYWDLFMLVLLIANLIILPVIISFFHDDLSTKWIVFNSISDTVFLTDLVINFRTGIIADNFADEVILDPRKIAIRYLKTFFILDLVSSIPLDYIMLIFSQETAQSHFVHAGRALRIFRLLKLLSLLRLLRLSRLVRYVSQWQEFISVAGKFMRVFNLVCLMLLISHWNGCLQWLVPMLQEYPPNSWVALEELLNADWLEQYTWSLFKALSHMLCIGYGRYPPQSITDVWLTMVSMLIGATCYAMVVGHATTLIQSFDTSKRLYREKLKQVEEYTVYRKLPRNLRRRITTYYEHRYHGKMFDEKSILEELNECLKEEVINFNCRSLVASVPFFAQADPNFVSEIISKLEFEVYQPGDVIIREGTLGDKMYFIQEGVVDIYTGSGDRITTLFDGAFFGEICLLTNAKRVANVRAESYCNLFSLSVQHFNSVLKHYPVMRKTMEVVASERLEKIVKDGAVKVAEMPRIRSCVFEDVAADFNIVQETMKEKLVPENRKRLKTPTQSDEQSFHKSASECNFKRRSFHEKKPFTNIFDDKSYDNISINNINGLNNNNSNQHVNNDSNVFIEISKNAPVVKFDVAM